MLFIEEDKDALLTSLNHKTTKVVKIHGSDKQLPALVIEGQESDLHSTTKCIS